LIAIETCVSTKLITEAVGRRSTTKCIR